MKEYRIWMSELTTNNIPVQRSFGNQKSSALPGERYNKTDPNAVIVIQAPCLVYRKVQRSRAEK